MDPNDNNGAETKPLDFSKTLREAFEENKIQQYKTDEIELLEELGKGAFGTVSKGRILKTGEIVAIKCLDQIDDKKGEEAIKTILNELKAMRRVIHPKIPYFYGIYQLQQENNLTIGLIFSFIEGKTLDKYLDENVKKLKNSEKCRLAIQLVEIIQILHQNRVTHRDIKPGNIMIKPDGDLVLLDFGISKVSECTMAFTNGVKCTPKYSAPEAFEDCGVEDVEYTITPKFDVWSMGCLIIEIFSGVAPWSKKFNDSNKIMMAMMKKVKYNGLDFPYHRDFDKEYPEVYKICLNCLVTDIKNRYTSLELLEKLKELEIVFKNRND